MKKLLQTLLSEQNDNHSAKDIYIFLMYFPQKKFLFRFQYLTEVCSELSNCQLVHIDSGEAVYPKNFHDSSDICPMGFIYSIQICEISHQTFGLRHQKYPTCPMIFMNTDEGVSCWATSQLPVPKMKCDSCSLWYIPASPVQNEWNH